MQTSLSLNQLKRSVTKNYKKLSKEETVEISQRVLDAVDKLKTLGYLKGFKGVPASLVKSDKVLARGLQAKNRLILSNIPFVIRMADRFAKGSTNRLENFVQEGIIGLNRATELYDHNTGYAFTTFAAFWIKQSLMTALRKESSMIKIAPNIYTLRNKILKYQDLNDCILTKSRIQELFEVTEKEAGYALAVPISISCDELDQNDDATSNSSSKLDNIPYIESEKVRRLEYYSDVVNSQESTGNPFLQVVFKDTLETLKLKQPLSFVQEKEIKEYLKINNA